MAITNKLVIEVWQWDKHVLLQCKHLEELLRGDGELAANSKVSIVSNTEPGIVQGSVTEVHVWGTDTTKDLEVIHNEFTTREDAEAFVIFLKAMQDEVNRIPLKIEMKKVL